MHKLPRTRLTLEKREATLRTLLTRSASEQKLLKAAARVHEARIQVLRATIGEMPTPIRTPYEDNLVAKLDRQIATLGTVTPLDILAEFRQSITDS